MNQIAPPPTAPTPENTIGVVLAGGASRRMPGRDKALLSVDGETLAHRACRRLLTQTRRVLLSSNNPAVEIAMPLSDSIVVISDAAISDLNLREKGPLSGVLSALINPRLSAAAATDEWLLLVPVDAPDFPENLLALFAVSRSDGKTISRSNHLDTEGLVRVAHDGQRLQPLFALIHRSVVIVLQRYLQEGGRSVHGWLKLQPHWQIDCSEQAEGFKNINEPEQWQDWSAKAAAVAIS